MILQVIIALVAGALHLYPVAAISADIAVLCFWLFIILFLVSLIFGAPWWRTGPPV